MRLIDADALVYKLGISDQDIYCKEIIEEEPTAQPEQRWIPCSEMPDTDRNVFIARGTPESMTVCVGHYQHDYEQWYEDRNWFATCLHDGLYWCEMPPLPEPYKGGRDADR